MPATSATGVVITNLREAPEPAPHHCNCAEFTDSRGASAKRHMGQFGQLQELGRLLENDYVLTFCHAAGIPRSTPETTRTCSSVDEQPDL